MKGLNYVSKSLKLVSLRLSGLVFAAAIWSSPASASQLQQLFEVALANNPQLSAAEADSAGRVRRKPHRQPEK
jgi:outer membrane protein